jgi:hypothetical protein
MSANIDDDDSDQDQKADGRRMLFQPEPNGNLSGAPAPNLVPFQVAESIVND